MGADAISTHGDARRRLFHPEASSLNPKFFRNGIVMLVLVVGTAALLFTWLTSSTTATDAWYSQFLQNVEAGIVATVVQEDDKLTVKPVGPGQRDIVFAPGVPGLPNSDVYGDMVWPRPSGATRRSSPTPTPSSRSPTTRGSGCS